MKIKTLIIPFLSLLLCASASAQKPAAPAQKLTVLVGATGEDPKGLRRPLEAQVKDAFVKDGRFIAVTREDAALSMIDKEHVYQRSGAVDDGQIRRLGAQAGARYVCVIEILPLMDSYTLSAQFVDIETTKILTMATVPSALKNRHDFLAASEALVNKLLGYSDRAAANTYGSGVFLDEGKRNPLSSSLAEILKQRMALSDGTCVGGVTAAIESSAEPTCAAGMVGTVCRADVTLVITQCKSGKKTVLRGAVSGSDKSSPENARRNFEKNMETAKFWDDWVRELEKLTKQ